MCVHSFVTSLLVFFSYLFVLSLFYLILDKNCGSKNWGGPVLPQTQSAIDRPQDGAALTNTYLQKYTHEQLTYPRVYLLFFLLAFPFIISHVYAVHFSQSAPRPAFVSSRSFLAYISFRQ